jgi:hypothetical protein
MCSSYVMDGATMDSKASECELSSTVKGFLRTDGGYFYCGILATLSSSAATEACTQLAILLNDYLLSAIVQTTYNEWGALLFLDEINLICQYVDQLCTQMDDNSEIKEALGPIKWAAKILALDQPGDIRKYNIVQGSSSSRPFRKLDEALVRDIMSRRVDFSKDVVSKIKINIA